MTHCVGRGEVIRESFGLMLLKPASPVEESLMLMQTHRLKSSELRAYIMMSGFDNIVLKADLVRTLADFEC
jgi:hypothetical protein